MLMLVVQFRGVSVRMLHGFMSMHMAVLAPESLLMTVRVMTVVVAVPVLVRLRRVNVTVFVLFRDREIGACQHDEQRGQEGS